MSQDEKRKLKLMVVDDEPDNLDLLYRTFRRDFNVHKAGSGPEALKILEKAGEMAVIISDQRMPQMNGTAFLSRTVDQFPDTIRIVLTGYTDVEDLVEAINSGKVFKYITKPWNPDELKRVVRQAAETYRVVKQRTNELNRALRRESLFNAVTTAIRESLDYNSMLSTIAERIGHTFQAGCCNLRLVHSVAGSDSDVSPRYSLSPTSFVYHEAADLMAGSEEDKATPIGCDDGEETVIQEVLQKQQIKVRQLQTNPSVTQLVVPLVYQQDFLAILSLYRESAWSKTDLQLIEDVAEQAALALSQAELYQRTQEYSQRMQRELEVARQIQMNLLRQSWPQFDHIKIQACCDPAQGVGGDFFEVYAHPQGDIWLAVGDVSGKGIPAALFMASAISLLRRELSQETPPDPNIVLQNLNRSLLEDLVSNNCFITIVLARYNPTTQQLVYANAGHVYPMVWSHRTVVTGRQVVLKDGQVEKNGGPPSTCTPNYLEVRGVPLGILPVWKADAGSLSLNEGEVLLLASDGITEATVANGAVGSGSMLRQSGLWQLLLHQSEALDLRRILAQIQAHHPVQEDDQTMLSLEVL